MKLWKISQVSCGWDAYDSAVVAAETEDAAKRIHPHGGQLRVSWELAGMWASHPEDVECEYLGEAKDGTPSGVICASYNGG